MRGRGVFVVRPALDAGHCSAASFGGFRPPATAGAVKVDLIGCEYLDLACEELLVGWIRLGVPVQIEYDRAALHFTVESILSRADRLVETRAG